MTAKEVQRIEKIALANLDTHRKTVRRIRHWQRRIWRASEAKQ